MMIRPTRYNIIATEQEREVPQNGILTMGKKTDVVVEAVGKGVTTVIPGDKIVYENTPLILERDGIKYLVLKEDDIVGIVE